MVDTKVVAMVGAVIVVGAAVYGVATGTVLPGSEDITKNESENGSQGNNALVTRDTGDGGGDETGGDENDTENVTQVSSNTTENVTDTGPEPLPVICEERGGNIERKDLENVPSSAGPPLDPLLAESMIHDALNKLRVLRSDAKNVDPLKCDPALREIAREHSKLKLIKEGTRGGDIITSDYERSQKIVRSLGGDLKIQDNIGEMTRNDIEINSTEKRYAGVCENPTEVVGQFFYQAYIEGGSSGDFKIATPDGSTDQKMSVIKNHQDLVRSARRHFLDQNLDEITSESNKRQGLGVAIDRRTREVYVTQVLCGPRSLNQTQSQSP